MLKKICRDYAIFPGPQFLKPLCTLICLFFFQFPKVTPSSFYYRHTGKSVRNIKEGLLRATSLGTLATKPSHSPDPTGLLAPKAHMSVKFPVITTLYCGSPSADWKPGGQ